MSQQIEPNDAQRLFKLVQALVAGYRNGGNVYVGVDVLSQEWERQNLPCAIEKHIQRHKLDEFIKNKIIPGLDQ